jgi:hypothetical protein
VSERFCHLPVRLADFGRHGHTMEVMRRFLLIPVAALLVGGCGSGSPTPTTPTPSPRATATPTPTGTPAPDVQRIDVISSGVGTWQLVAVPVAVIHNAATRTGVSGVIVHFTLLKGGRTLSTLESPQVTLYPGQTLVVTSYQCTDYPCYTADSVTVTVGSGTWAALPGAPLAAAEGHFTCTRGCAGHGQWDVPISVASPDLLANEQVDLFASCSNAAGSIIGGGSRQLLWPQPGGSLNLSVPVIVNAPPASCQVGATTSN